MKKLLLIGLLSFGTCFTKENVSHLAKMFMHHGHCQDKLVFYFRGMPKLVESHLAKNKVEVVLENVAISDVANKLMNQFAHKRHYGFKMHFLKQGNNLVLHIAYDPQKITQIVSSRFKAISQFDGITIFINKANRDSKVSSCRRSVEKKRPTIVIDIGHGGTDPGAAGHNGILEKDVVFEVGKKLSAILKRSGCGVHLTRSIDTFVPLDKRTSFANLDTKAHVLVSLHANSSGNSKVKGLETYHLDHNLLKPQKMNFMQKDLSERSKKLAGFVHSAALSGAARHHDIVDRKVKGSVSQLLLGAEMPSVLIELGFITNADEGHLLNSPKYQKELAQSIKNGLHGYFTSTA